MKKYILLAAIVGLTCRQTSTMPSASSIAWGAGSVALAYLTNDMLNNSTPEEYIKVVAQYERSRLFVICSKRLEDTRLSDESKQLARELLDLLPTLTDEQVLQLSKAMISSASAFNETRYAVSAALASAGVYCAFRALQG